MSLFNLKAPTFHHLDLGIHGTFIRFDEESTDPGFVWVWYRPMNSFANLRCEKPIKWDHIHETTPKRTDIPGVPNKEVIVFTGEEGSLINTGIVEKQNKTIKELREKIHALKMQLSSAKQTTEDAASGAESYVARAQQIAGSNRNRMPHGRGGLMDQDEFDF